MSELGFSPGAIRSELARICESAIFSRSIRLRCFLTYVCELTIAGEASRINEHLIGVEVFERGPDYSPTVDSIVRREAHALRHKLDEYYRQHGPNNPIRIEMPRGHYVPVFRRQSHTAQGEHSASGSPERNSPGPSRRSLAVSALAGGLAVFVAGWLLSHKAVVPSSALKNLPAPVVEIWGPWFEDRTAPLICVSNPMSMVVQYFEGFVPQAFAPRRFRASDREQERIRQAFRLPAGGQVYLGTSVSQAKMGEAMGVGYLANLFGRAGLSVQLTQSRFLDWGELRSNNCILLGNNETNPWLDPILEDYPLQLEQTSREKPRGIVNLKLRPGEAAQYHVEYPASDDRPTVEYALVSMLPGLDGHHKLLLINGLNTQATQKAIEFLTDPAGLQDLTEALSSVAPNHEGPWFFQLILRTVVRDKSPTSFELVLVRVV